MVLLFAGCSDESDSKGPSQVTTTLKETTSSQEKETQPTTTVESVVSTTQKSTETAAPAESMLVSGLSDKGFLASYGGYKFRIEGFLYDGKNIRGMTFDMMRPDGTFVVAQATAKTPSIMPFDGLEISFPVEYAKESGGEKIASIYVKKAVMSPPHPSAELLTRVSDEGFLQKYGSYRFKVDHFIYDAEYEVTGVLLDVQKPDGTIVQSQASRLADALVDDMQISLIPGCSVDTEELKETALYVWTPSA